MSNSSLIDERQSSSYSDRVQNIKKGVDVVIAPLRTSAATTSMDFFRTDKLQTAVGENKISSDDSQTITQMKFLSWALSKNGEDVRGNYYSRGVLYNILGRAFSEDNIDAYRDALIAHYNKYVKNSKMLDLSLFFDKPSKTLTVRAFVKDDVTNEVSVMEYPINEDLLKIT